MYCAAIDHQLRPAWQADVADDQLSYAQCTHWFSISRRIGLDYCVAGEAGAAGATPGEAGAVG